MPNDSSTICVRFNETTKEINVESRSIYQHDHGLTLKVYGLGDLKIGQVHFSNSDTGKALNVLATTNSDGSISVSIPDVLLAQDKDIHAFLYFEDETSGCTVRTVRIPITPRAKPETITLESPLMGAINQIAQELSALIGEVNELKKETATATKDANAAATKANAAATSASTSTTNANKATTSANTAAKNAQNAADKLNSITFEVDPVDGYQYMRTAD